MHTPEGDKLAPHDRVTVQAEYVAPHPVLGDPVLGSRVVLRTLAGHAFDAPIEAVRLVRVEPPQWVVVHAPMGADASYFALYRRSNTGHTWVRHYVSSEGNAQLLDELSNVLGHIGVRLEARPELHNRYADEPFPEVVDADAMDVG